MNDDKEHIAIHNVPWEESDPKERKLMHLQWHMDHFRTVYNRCDDLTESLGWLKVGMVIVIVLLTAIAVKLFFAGL